MPHARSWLARSRSLDQELEAARARNEEITGQLRHRDDELSTKHGELERLVASSRESESGVAHFATS